MLKHKFDGTLPDIESVIKNVIPDVISGPPRDELTVAPMDTYKDRNAYLERQLEEFKLENARLREQIKSYKGIIDSIGEKSMKEMFGD
jgi:hypothetical protein